MIGIAGATLQETVSFIDTLSFFSILRSVVVDVSCVDAKGGGGLTLRAGDFGRDQ